MNDDSGAITPLIVVLFIGIILTTGVAIDLLRHEAARADLQASLDRGVLASTSLRQTVGVETIIDEYVENRIWSGIPADVAVVTGGDGVSSRTVTASAAFMLDSMFLRLAGLDQLRVAAAAGASESHTNIEISLVLDISGTMRYNTGNNYVAGQGLRRIEFLRPAAKDFIEDVVGGANAAFTSMSIIPYAGGVNPGPRMYELLGGQIPARHDESHCLEFTRSDFFTEAEYDADPDLAYTGLPDAGFYNQVAHFHYWTTDTGWMDWGWCPTDDRGAITYLSNDVEILQGVIDDLRLHDGTGTYNAMRWGLALLDPASQPILSILADEGVFDDAFADRPSAFAAPGGVPAARKIIVLMTDGQITEQHRPKNPDDPRLATKELANSPFGGGDREVPPYMDAASGRDYFYGLCEAAKANGVEIFTIAFNAPSGASVEMQYCASDPKTSHFYEVDGGRLATAFEDIANQISRLRLTN